jgi:dTDP-4-amino-4,6-dideoxygalactose transaminase
MMEQLSKTGVLDDQKIPAAVGGKPAFDKMVPIIYPNMPPWESIRKRFERIYRSKMITNFETVKEVERVAKSYLEVDNVVAISSCTLGLILTLKALGIKGEVIVPSFTFSATGHAIYWAGATPVFVDCSARDWNISLESVQEAISYRTEAILAVHIFGNPSPAHALEEISQEYGIKLIFDAAHAFGASIGGKPTGGFGDAEVFSLSPTKLVTGGEGGLLATNNGELAELVKRLRNYGDKGNYDCLAPGINARMEELNAAMILEGIPLADPEIITRQRLASLYRKDLGGIPGITFQEVPPENHHTYKDFTILIEPDEFGMNRDSVYSLLMKENIQTKKYFYPPLHMQSAYQNLPQKAMELGVTEKISKNVLTLPLYSKLGETGVRRIAAALASLHIYRNELV